MTTILPFKKAAQMPSDMDSLGCVRFTFEEMEAFAQLRCHPENGVSIFKDVTLRASQNEAGYNFKLSCELPVYMSIGKIRSGKGAAYVFCLEDQPSVLLDDFDDVMKLALDARDAVVPLSQAAPKVPYLNVVP